MCINAIYTYMTNIIFLGQDLEVLEAKLLEYLDQRNLSENERSEVIREYIQVLHNNVFITNENQVCFIFTC